MTKEVYDKIVAPVAPFEEIEKKPMTIVEFIEEVRGHELSKWQKEYITAAYEYYKDSPNGIVVRCARGTTKTNVLPLLAVAFAAYEENELY